MYQKSCNKQKSLGVLAARRVCRTADSHQTVLIDQQQNSHLPHSIGAFVPTPQNHHQYALQYGLY